MKVISYHSDEGTRTALLVSTGRKFHKVILLDNPIRVRAFPLKEERYFSDLERNGHPYPVKRMTRILRDAVKSWHGSMRDVSKEVREALS